MLLATIGLGRGVGLLDFLLRTCSVHGGRHHLYLFGGCLNGNRVLTVGARQDGLPHCAVELDVADADMRGLHGGQVRLRDRIGL